VNKLLSRRGVERVILAVSSTTAITLGVVLYDSNVELQERERQLDKAQLIIEHQQSDYKTLEQKFFSVKSESEKLSKRQEELMSHLNKLKQENNGLKSENRSLKSEMQTLKKNKVDVSASSSVASTNYKDWKRMVVEATGYSLISDEFGSDGDSLTATGTQARVGIIAVDPRVIPLGSTVYIPAFGREFRAEDTGGMIKGHHIDIYMAHGDQAREWGRKTIEIYVKP
jgi:3D (Asp-Asp-Asp) domain-containing protein